MQDNSFDKNRQARVSERAYERYVARGSQDGQDVEDWLAAEGEIQAEDEQAMSTEAVSARMDAAGPVSIEREDAESARREAEIQNPQPTPPVASRRGRTGGRQTLSAQA